MSRRSQRLTRYSQGDDDGSSSSGGSSVAGSQSTLFKDSPLRTLKRKSSNMKRLSPAPQLGPSSDAHTSYYSESLVHESWFPPRSSLEELHGDANWGEDLRVRRRRGTGGSESSRASGLVGRKATEDFLGSSSGYSSEDDYVGYSDVDQQSSSSRLRSAVSRAGSLLWMVATSPGRLFRLLYWWAGTTWYRLTTAASLLDVFVLTSMTQESFQESSVKELRRLEDQLAGLQQELAALALKQSSVAEEVGLLPQQIQAVRDDVESQFPAWISQFLARGGGGRVGLLQREEMQAQLRELESKILTHVAEMQGKSAREAAASLSLTLQKEGVIGVTEEQVHHIVKQALQRYSEDRIGLADYALESGGASVISTRCSETYETKTALLSLFGIPLWYHSQSPRVILQPDVHPGNCWAFQGPQGFAVVRLSARIRPTAVTLEHVPKALSPNSTISSAPKDFAIFGFDEDLQQEGTLLGKFTYDQDGEPIQTFHFQAPTMATYQVVELRILTNWGHPEYTCIYRFRVHGEPAH
ncbi:SUN domain-containing protein 2 isoform 11 [Homo sapiens]|uniref:SUN domain-containing protein 2 isoform 11 n=1 Tax=Homo sapiens TaxID=9606 RepID=UPI001B39F72F|nr:SUN domain-containing protein 2 isoform 11 [Homo sapiens]NP_001381374.1 SUN domain-containing protein 2 isoform 11 [Homo sapiens]